jgi:hypothetical protein
MPEGVDYAWGRPSVASLLAAGVKFVCRYLSHDTSGKNLDHAEAVKLAAGGLWIVVVWETTAQRALAGKAAGVQDAKDAAAMAKECGMPDDRPIYFAVDWDASSGEQAAINAYLDGAASVLGKGRTGIYGGYNPVKRALDGDHCRWAWQTYAWSGGRWDSRAQIQQYLNDQTIGGVGLDYDRSTTSDYGQWKPGETVALDSTDVKKIWTTDGIVAVPSGDPINPFWTPGYHLTNLGQHVRILEDKVNALATAVAALPGAQTDTAAIVAGVLAGLDPAALADAIATHLDASVAGEVLDALKARLEA